MHSDREDDGINSVTAVVVTVGDIFHRSLGNSIEIR